MNIIGQWVVLSKYVKSDIYGFYKGTLVQITSESENGYDIQDCDGRPIFGCGYDFYITPHRQNELFNNMINHITELVSGCDLVDTMHAIGFTDKEMEVFEIPVERDEE